MNNVTCHYTQYKCSPHVGGETQTRNSKALLTELLRPSVMDKKKNRGPIFFCYDCSNWLVSITRRKSILETPQRGEAGAVVGAGAGVELR